MRGEACWEPRHTLSGAYGGVGDLGACRRVLAEACSGRVLLAGGGAVLVEVLARGKKPHAMEVGVAAADGLRRMWTECLDSENMGGQFGH